MWNNYHQVQMHTSNKCQCVQIKHSPEADSFWHDRRSAASDKQPSMQFCTFAPGSMSPNLHLLTHRQADIRIIYNILISLFTRMTSQFTRKIVILVGFKPNLPGLRYITTKYKARMIMNVISDDSHWMRNIIETHNTNPNKLSQAL